MAALGDSITRAFNSEINPPTCPILPAGFLDCPKNSWSTGTNPAVNSQFQRIEAIDPGRNPVAINDAVSGAGRRLNRRQVDLLGQAETAATQDPDYVTIEIGGNDACTARRSPQQTPTADFRDQVETALNTLVSADPKVYIQMASIPDINQLTRSSPVLPTRTRSALSPRFQRLPGAAREPALDRTGRRGPPGRVPGPGDRLQRRPRGRLRRVQALPLRQQRSVQLVVHSGRRRDRDEHRGLAHPSVQRHPDLPVPGQFPTRPRTTSTPRFWDRPASRRPPGTPLSR